MAGNVFVPGGVSYPTSGILANNIMLRGGTSAGLYTSNVITSGGSIADLPISANHHGSSKKPPIKFSGINAIRNGRIVVCRGTSAGNITVQRETSASFPASGVSPGLMVVTIPGGQRVSYAFPETKAKLPFYA